MLRRVAMMGSGWLVASLVVAGMVVPIASDPAHAGKLSSRVGAAVTKAAVKGAVRAATRKDNDRDQDDDGATQSNFLRLSKKPVEGEPAAPVRVINGEDRAAAAAAAARAEQKLIENGERIGPPPAVNAADAAKAASQTIVDAQVSSRGTGQAAGATINGAICVAGCWR